MFNNKSVGITTEVNVKLVRKKKIKTYRITGMFHYVRDGSNLSLRGS